ncbi:IS1595 family transposase [Alicyclobacillus sp. ALC3]|uniref:IS1595 family transposase n=1 Tax=Alicyclobacillus sp. ALC3 TaxID=2796143 RepID=UPI0023794541|nr:IS1595 family transposase [Alicyclobacillus sp. ALC3]
MRWKEGFTCPKCNHPEAILVHATHRRDADRRVPLFECKQCHRQTSVTSGTIFHKTKTPLYKWFLAIYLASNDKRGVSAKTLQRHISVSYDTVWNMLHKIRHAMGERNAKYNWRASFKSMTSTLVVKAKANGDVAQHSHPCSWAFHSRKASPNTVLLKQLTT